MSKPMLVTISFGLPRQQRKLNDEAAKLEEENKTAKGVISKPSSYYFRTANSDGLRNLKSFNSDWKTSLTSFARYPFAGGVKILPVGLIDRFNKANESFKADKDAVFERWKTDFYMPLFESAKTRMGLLYLEEDFPTIEDCRKRFTHEVTIVPMPDSDQWARVSEISPDMKSTMMAQQAEVEAKSTRNAHAAIWNEVLKKIDHINTVLMKDKSKIYDSLIGNVNELLDLIPAYAELHQDKNLTLLAENFKAIFSTITPEDLRNSAEEKIAAARAAAGLVSDFKKHAPDFSDLEEAGE